MRFMNVRAIPFLLVLAACFLSAPMVSAQNTPNPIPIPPGGGGTGMELGMTIDDITVEPGELFEIIVELDNPNPIIDFQLYVDSTSPMDCQFLVTNLGAGIDAYSAIYGTLPPGQCDVVTTPLSIWALMFFAPAPYQSSICGNEIYRITCAAGMTPGEVLLPWFSTGSMGGSSGNVVVTIDDPTPSVTKVMRGDVNLDSACNLTDAVNLLDYLYVGNFEINCPDSCDLDDSGSINLADAVNLLSGLFGGGFTLEDTCKADSTPDPLAECNGSPCP